MSQDCGSKRIYNQLKLLNAANALVVVWPIIDPEIDSIKVVEISNSYSTM